MENVELPDIDYLIKLGKNSPEDLIKLRDNLVNKIINRQICEIKKDKLITLQSNINMIHTGSSNNMHSCIRISKLMKEKLYELDFIFKNGKPLNKNKEESKVIEFKKPL